MTAFVEVLPPELTGPDHSEWFEARRAGITASEIAAVLRLSPYESPFSLYWRKKGAISEQPDTDAMRWGRRLERHIAEEFQERHPEFVVLPGALVAHKERPWQMASPDAVCRELVGEPGLFMRSLSEVLVAAVEVKTTGSWDGWGEDGSDEIPLHIRCQVIWQADVLGVPCVYVPVVNGRTYREYCVQYDPADAEFMRGHAEVFLLAVREGVAPPLDGADATLRTLRQLHPDLDDTEAEVPATLAKQWAAACAAEKRAKTRKKTAEARLRDRMGRARVAVHAGQKVATRVIYERKPYQVGPSTVDSLRPAKEPA